VDINQSTFTRLHKQINSKKEKLANFRSFVEIGNAPAKEQAV
jgi:hypothetical protein